MPENPVGVNIARLRKDRNLTQAALGELAGLSRTSVGKIERGVTLPRDSTLRVMARALEVPVADLVRLVSPLERVRFRGRSRVHGRQQILAEVSRWLEDYNGLEHLLGRKRPNRFDVAETDAKAAAKSAREAVGLRRGEAIRDICGLLEDNGVKLRLLNKSRDSFFGLSVGAPEGPAVVVNTWDRISVERWIFTAAHELGHLILHTEEYAPGLDATDQAVVRADTEKSADAFASHFLMPEPAFAAEWGDASGLGLVQRVLKVKRIFRVSYKTVLYRLVETGQAPRSVWGTFQALYRRIYGHTLAKADEPDALRDTEFKWDWRRSREPGTLSEHDFVNDRLARLVREALERHAISRSRAAEILGISVTELRGRLREWIA